MKRILTLFILTLSIFLLAGCADKKIKDDSIKVYFYKYTNESIDDRGNPVVPNYEVFEEGDLIPEPEKPLRSGFDFKGWFTDVDRTQEWDFDVHTVGSKTMILYAGWEARDLIITFILNGGTISSKQDNVQLNDDFEPFISIDTSITIVIHQPSSRPGYTFLGWFKYDEFGWKEDAVTSHRPGETGITMLRNISEDMVLYAHWRENK